MSEWIAAVTLVTGGVFALLAGIGIVRMPDLLTRMQATSKAGTLGVGLIAIGAALAFGTAEVAVRSGLIVVFLFLTAPVGAHLIARSALRSGLELSERTRIDELRARTPRDPVKPGSSGP